MGNCLGPHDVQAANLPNSQDQLTAHTSKSFMISCMDFRLIDDLVRAMDTLGYNNNYDQFIVAGASLGITQTKFPHWGHTALDHMEIGLALHHFREFIIFDHMDCGAYRKFYPEIKSEEEEIQHHVEHLQQAHDSLARKFPNFKLKAYLMKLDGSFTEVKIKTDDIQFDEKALDLEKNKFLSDMYSKKRELTKKLLNKKY